MDVNGGYDMRAATAETHVSVVVFMGERAFKVKKPIRTAFLDYSTREARAAACHREVESNRRLAPDVYLGVADVVGPDGEVCDHLVAMRRMPDERRLATLVQDRAATKDDVVAVARAMASFHDDAHRGPAIDAAATPAAVRRLWVDNFHEMTGFSRWLLAPESLGAIEAMALTYLDGREPLFEERIRRGRIVDGHGDLLAADIFCLDDGPRILDCLEFDDRLRYGDVLLDVGFLAMDLERLGQPRLARHFLDSYRALSGETHPRSLEHHYIAYRALVRSKVACLLVQDGRPAATEATALLDLCARHLYEGRVRMVVVGGMPGTGKSTVADGLGLRMNCAVLRSDQIRKELAGLAGTDHAASPYQQGIYSPSCTDATYAELLRRADVALARGESVVLDAMWPSHGLRNQAQRVARANHAEIIELCCTCPAELADARLSERFRHGRDPSDATVEVAARLRACFDGWPSAVVVDTAGPPSGSIRRAMQALGALVALPPTSPHAST